MGYFKRPLHGLGGAESCGPDQVWDPDYVFQGIKGQCLSKAQYQALYPQGKPAAKPSFAENFFKALTTTVAPAPAAQTVYVPAPRSGISTTTLVIGGVAVLGLLALLATRD